MSVKASWTASVAAFSLAHLSLKHGGRVRERVDGWRVAVRSAGSEQQDVVDDVTERD